MIRLFLLLTSLSLSLLASSIGHVTDMHGNAWIFRGDHNLTLSPSASLQEHDQIVTAEDAWVTITLNDQTHITVGQQAKLTIDSYRFDHTTDSHASFTLGKGIFQAVSGAIGKVARKNFHVQTPTATIGIRGTEFYVDARSEEERYLCTRGAIVVKSNFGTRGPAKELIVPAGEQAVSAYLSGKPVAQPADTRLLNDLQNALGLH